MRSRFSGAKTSQRSGLPRCATVWRSTASRAPFLASSSIYAYHSPSRPLKSRAEAPFSRRSTLRR